MKLNSRKLEEDANEKVVQIIYNEKVKKFQILVHGTMVNDADTLEEAAEKLKEYK
jgi:hypothetical protein